MFLLPCDAIMFSQALVERLCREAYTSAASRDASLATKSFEMTIKLKVTSPGTRRRKGFVS